MTREEMRPYSIAAALYLALTPFSLHAQTVRLEAENARLEGPDLHVSQDAPAQGAAGYSGKGYVTGFVNLSDRLVFTLPNARGGVYDLRIGFRSAGHRGYELFVNDLEISGTFSPTTPDGFETQDAGKIELKEGQNTLAINGGWQRYDIDFVEVTPSGPIRPPQPPTTPLSDPKATPEARALLKRLNDVYGRGTLMGVYSDEDAQYVFDTTGARPAIMGADLSSYSPSSMERRPHESEIVERMITRSKEGYIDTFSWHWVPPFGLLNRTLPAQNGKPAVDARWNRGFYTDSTNFDVSIAVDDPQSMEHTYVLRDIDAIAVQLKKLQAAGVPVLFRPLHEAQGGWFWWGAKGPEPFIKLWRLLYDRLVNVDGVHNLVWVYTSADDAAWYPGDAYVDVVGADAYPKDLRDPQSELWTRLSTEFAGRKPVALSEFGGVPDVARMQRLGVYWVYAVSWNGSEGPRKNTPEALKEIYSGSGALKLETYRPQAGETPGKKSQ